MRLAERSAPPVEAPPTVRLVHEPALDGLRAVAVVLVVLFHAGVGTVQGGYVGVSVFFTLSGFLITSLLLDELHDTGRVDIGRFAARRVRRLLPASLCCIAVCALGVRLGVFPATGAVRRDLTGATLQIANWTSLAGTGSYRALLDDVAGAGSPVAHFWSLSIEEQFYWVWPLTLAALSGRLRRRRAGHGSSPARPAVIARRIGLLTLAAAVTAPLVAALAGPDAAYWATPARSAEILVGALLAALVRVRDLPARISYLAVPALAVVLSCAVLLPPDGGPAYEGWLPLFALASAALVAGLLRPGPLRTALSTRPFVHLGAISYGVYLVHWPLFLVLDEERTGLDGGALLVLRLAATWALAELSARVVERPVRGARWAPLPTLALGAGATAAVTLLVTTTPVVADRYWQAAGLDAAISAAPAPAPAVARAVAPAVAPATSSTPPPAATVRPTPSIVTSSVPSTSSTTAAPSAAAVVPTEPPPAPPRLLVVGDSTAEATGAGLVEWATSHPEWATVAVRARPGCGFLLTGTAPEDGDTDWTGPCRDLLDEQLPVDIGRFRPDLVVVVITLRDLIDRVWEDDEGVIDPQDARFRRRLALAYRQRFESLLALGVPRVAFVLPPIPDLYWQAERGPSEDPARFAVFDDVVHRIAAADPDRAVVVDLRGHVSSSGLARDHEARPDGLHWALPASSALAERWLGPVLVGAALSATP